MKRSVLLLAGAVVGLTACDSFREAMTAHVDTAARAGSQELSVQQLADLLGNAPMPLNKDVAKAVAQVWVDYQLLGQAAVVGDSLSDSATVNSAMWSQFANLRVSKLMQGISKDWVVPAAPPTEGEYNQGSVLAASHILFRFPDQAPSEAVRDSVRLVAESVRAQVTPENFADMARKHSADGSAQQGGDLGVFPAGMMVPEFGRAVAALKPGEISPLVLTQFGYHIIMRTPFTSLNKDQYAQLASQQKAAAAESTYRAKVEETARVNLRPDLAKTIKEVAADPEAHRKDKTVLATWNDGEFTAGRLAEWVQASPPQQQMRQQIAAMPDSMAPQVVRQFVFFDLLLEKADSANVQVDTLEMKELHQAFRSAVTSAWAGLGVSPSALADSAKTQDDRARLAAGRVNSYFAQLLRNEVPFVQVPPPVENVLRDKYSYKVNDAGLDRALELAAVIRTSADSARAASQPASAVPAPGAATQPPPAGTTPPPQPQPQP
ncbi:MAG: peptidylprolyl isomerase [Gemmatimonadaceae bacterium]